MSIELIMPSNHLILCHPLLLLPSIFPSIRVFSHELAVYIRWPEYWSFILSPSNGYSGLISFRTDWCDSLLSTELSRVFSSTIVNSLAIRSQVGRSEKNSQQKFLKSRRLMQQNIIHYSLFQKFGVKVTRFSLTKTSRARFQFLCLEGTTSLSPLQAISADGLEPQVQATGICQACLQRVVLVQAAGHPDSVLRSSPMEDGEGGGGHQGRSGSGFLSFIYDPLQASSDHFSGSRGRTKGPAVFLDAQNSSYRADSLSAKFVEVLISLVHHFPSSRRHAECLNPETPVSHCVASVPVWVSCLFQQEVTSCLWSQIKLLFSPT